MLREGGRGLATVIYPNLLPFISKVPPGIAEPKLEYFRTFFSSIIQGYEQPIFYFFFFFCNQSLLHLEIGELILFKHLKYLSNVSFGLRIFKYTLIVYLRKDYFHCDI